MNEKSNSSTQKKDDASTEKQSESSTQKITNFFPLLKTEGRAKMCASKTDDSKQKEMLKKIRGKESMTLRSKKQDRVKEKPTNGPTTSQAKEKIRNISVASALKTPLSQVLRKSIEACDRKEIAGKSNQLKNSEISGKIITESKKSLSDTESGRMLRQKTSVPEKPVRANIASKRKTDLNNMPTGNEKVKTESTTTAHRGRPPKIALETTEENKSDSASLNSNSSSKVRKYRKRHFRGSTYGLYLTPARKKKKKLKSQDECKDDDGSVTSTENNSFLDSEDANSLVSEDCFTPSEKSLIDEEHGLESQNSSTVLSTEKKYEKSELNSYVEAEEQNSIEQTTKIEKSNTKIEISADYEENTQNVTDLFPDLDEMQWESNQKMDNVLDNTNTSQNRKPPQYDDVSSESFTNSLHFSFKKNSEDLEENFVKEDMPQKSGEAILSSDNNDCNIRGKSNDKIDLPETSETCLSINDNISEIFDMKEESNIDMKEESNSDMKEESNIDMKEDSNIDMKEDSNICTKEDSNIDMKENANNIKESSIIDIKEDSNLDTKEDSNLDTKEDSIIDTKEDSNLDTKEDSNIDTKEDSNVASSISSENKDDDLNLLDSAISEIKDDLNLGSTGILSNKDNLNLLFSDVNQIKDDLIASDINEAKDLNLDSSELPEKESFNIISSHVFDESRDNSNQMTDINEDKGSVVSPLHLPESGEINNSDSLLASDFKQDSNSLPYTDINKQDSNSSHFTNEKEPSYSLQHKTGENKEIASLSLVGNEPKEMLHENKENNNFDSSMEIDNIDKQDDENDVQSIANCVKSRQRIKRRFTDDIVDTDLGILSVAAMASVKKSMMAKQEPPKDVIENFQSISRVEAKRSGAVAKIECVFNYKQSAIKSCTCESDSFKANIEKNNENAFCQAVDAIDDKLLGCTNPVVTPRLVRPSVKLAFTIMCETHLWRLKHHHACPYCGLFCSQGSFMECSNTDNPQFIHLFHEQCQSKEDGAIPFCFHCGCSTSLKRVQLEMHMASPPAFFLNQTSKVSVPDVSKARISFSESDISQKEDDDPSQVFKIEDSGKLLSSAGLPNGSSKEELEKLLNALNEEKIQSYNFASDEFYDMAAAGDVLKVIYMLVKGFDPNQKFPSHDGETALHAAATNGHVTVVHLLIQAGSVNDSLNEKMYTPLMVAVENGHKDVVHYLVKKGAITDFKGENGMSSLHLAAKGGNLDILKILMSSRDTDIDAQDDGGWTPIVWASEHDHLNVVKYLLKRGANPNIRDNEGNIGLHWSAFSGSVEISYLYLDYGCDINAVNELGDSPLHIAARQDSFPCVTLFLSRAADVTILNKAEKLPAECCIDKNSDTYLSLSLNMLLKKITRKYQHKAEKILHRDVTRGKEQLAIQCVNAVDDEMPPLDFLYVTENCETMPIRIDRTITSLQSCHCEDDCSTASCNCASISYQCWYDKEGLLLPEFNLLDPPMLFECNRACSCWSLNCHNRVLQNGITVRLQLIRTKGKGWGVRTLKDIPKGAFICEYVGELISDSAADKRSDDSYLFDLDNRDGETYCLDARYYGNISRFINHLCEPNLVPVKVYVDHQDLNFPRIAFFSSRDIKQYEELGFDYGEKFWAIKYKFFTCECGTPKCKYSKESIHVTLANYYRRLKEEQMDEIQQPQVPVQ